jgi:phosphoglycerate dehydrogenase-like enzyme
VPTPVIVVHAPGTSLPADFELLDGIAEVIAVDDAEALRAAQDRAEVLLQWDFSSPLLREAGAGRLAWIHTASVGVDAVMTPEVVASSAVVTNARGVFEPPVAEWALTAWLYLAKELGRALTQQRRAEWQPYAVGLAARRRVVVLGVGPIGREIARLLRAVGASVDVVARTARDDEPGLGRVHAIDELDALLPEAHDVILALPQTAETTGILNAERIARLRPGAHVINVGRGGIIDQTALIAALREGTVGAAALDVFAAEPLPADDPLWSMENVLVSPHMSGEVAGWERTVLELFVANLEGFVAGEPLANVVDKAQFAAAAEGTVAA